MLPNSREEMRKVFFEAWRKHKNNLPIEALEAQLIDIILLHPEYHELLKAPDDFQAADFDETNPFLHLSLHLAVREQINTNRPLGIKTVYENLCKKNSDAHVVEHKMLECLGQILWDAQSSGKMPEEDFYLESLKKL